jgi:hypothetical protein
MLRSPSRCKSDTPHFIPRDACGEESAGHFFSLGFLIREKEEEEEEEGEEDGEQKDA